MRRDSLAVLPPRLSDVGELSNSALSGTYGGDFAFASGKSFW